MSWKTKGLIFYSDGLIREPIRSMALESLPKDIPHSVSVLDDPKERGYPRMVKQIISCLRDLDTQYVFFCEHDVIYNPTHFDFTPEFDDVFYYNENVWRWDYPSNRYITYDRLISLSALCVNREFALEHYERRLAYIEDMGEDKPHKGEPHWLRKMGYEPGTKKKKRGGFSDDDFVTWRSEKPLIDIRHDTTLSPRKVTLAEFKHLPTGWREIYERP